MKWEMEGTEDGRNRNIQQNQMDQQMINYFWVVTVDCYYKGRWHLKIGYL